jgi:D-alanyl-D-alanine carboxypeptidase
MLNTNFDSPHGLQNHTNISTAFDMAILSYHCMKNKVFREVVKTPLFEVLTPFCRYEWQNTNRLLGFDFDAEDCVEFFKGTIGCKTGVTQSAGPCFSGCFERKYGKGKLSDNCIVVVLGCKSMESRWVEVPALVKWY